MLAGRGRRLKPAKGAAENSGGIGSPPPTARHLGPCAIPTIPFMSLAVHLILFAGLTAGALSLRLALDWALRRDARTPTSEAIEAIEDPQKTPRRAA